MEQAGGQADVQHEEDPDQGVHLGAALGHDDQGRGHAQGHLAEEERWVEFGSALGFVKNNKLKELTHKLNKLGTRKKDVKVCEQVLLVKNV